VFDVLDAALTKGPWLLGENFSAADIAIGSGLNFCVRLFKMVPRGRRPMPIPSGA
jgi:glutathione S-transferase